LKVDSIAENVIVFLGSLIVAVLFIFQYETSQIDHWTNYAVMKTAVDEGVRRGQTEGRSEGIELGKAEEKIEIAQNM